MTAPNTRTPLPAARSDTPCGQSVLVVDDESMIRRIAQLSLTGAGYTVAEAAGAAAAIGAVRGAKAPFDLILLDFTMPDGDGTAVIPVIRQLAPRSRILVVSGHGEMDASNLGADGYLAKPFTKASLLAAVRRALAR
jgi:two-component system, NtrC family, response regulator AtoC